VYGDTDAASRAAAYELPSDPPPEGYTVRRAAGGLLLVLWLPQHTRSHAGRGCGAGTAGRLAREPRKSRLYLLDRPHRSRRSGACHARQRRARAPHLGSVAALQGPRHHAVVGGAAQGSARFPDLRHVRRGDRFQPRFLLLIDDEQRELRGAVAVGPASGEEASAIWNSIEKERPTLDQILRRAIEDPETEPTPGSLADRIRKFALPLDPEFSLLARAASASPGSFNIHQYTADQGPSRSRAAFGAHEFVVIPIQGRERTLGVIVADNLYSGEPSRPTMPSCFPGSRTMWAS
jgi:hypothetical protein